MLLNSEYREQGSTGEKALVINGVSKHSENNDVLRFCVRSTDSSLPHNPIWAEGLDPEPNPDPVTGAPENPV